MALSKILFLSILLLFFLAQRIHSRFYDDKLKITFFDVGQGDSALVQFPKGKILLVDAGGGFGDWDLGSRELFPELARLGILHLDIALLTHPDQDHGYGFKGIFKELKVDQFWLHESFARHREEHPLLQKLLPLAESKGIALKTFSKDSSFLFEGASLRVFALGTDEKKTNDRSLVSLLEFAGCSFLLTGDIEARAEYRLLHYSIPRLTFLKVAHHGSKTSSTEAFLNQFPPQIGIISVGNRNRYGHPNPGVVERLLRHHVQLFRTDLHGFVRFTVWPDGRYHCETAQGNCGEGTCQ